jgi:putative oxidoreductase
MTSSLVSRDAGLLVIRLAIGLSLAFLHGIGKVPPAERFIAGVTDMGFPLPVLFAWAAGLSEFVGGLLVAIGLFTRPAAASIAITMAVAAFIRHAGDPLGDRELPIVFLCIAVGVLLTGAGAFSVDAWWQQRRAK